MRVTMGMISRSYTRNLNNSLNQLNYYNMRATNFRKFSSVSQDPVGAMKAFRARREFLENEDFQTSTKDVQSLMMTAESAVRQINTIVQEANSTDILYAINSTQNQEERQIIATKLRKVQESILSTINAKYSDKFIFGGSNTDTPPFTVGDNGELLYRGVNVTTGEHVGSAGTAATLSLSGAQINFGVENGSELNNYMIKIVDGTGAATVDQDAKTITLQLDIGTATNQDLQDALQNAVQGAGLVTDASKITVADPAKVISAEGVGVVSGGKDAIAAGTKVNLDALAKEQVFVDLGLGLNIGANGKVDSQSAFDISLPGISFLGYGKDSDGNPQNIYSILGEIADRLESDNFNYDDVKPLIEASDKQYQKLLMGVTEFGTKAKFLDFNQDKLEEGSINLNEKMKNIEMIDPAKAIMEFKEQEYAYRAALQMGSRVLQNSFLDYMR